MPAGSRKSRVPGRRGVVAVEFALSAVALILMLFVSLEFARMNMLRHSADNAAYEAARSAIVPGATVAEAEQTARAIMGVVWARGVDVDVDPTVIQNSTPEVAVTVTVPADGNGLIAPRFFSGKSYVGQCRLRREDIGS